jgi:imidazolonepropionase-like amidohydrolase
MPGLVNLHSHLIPRAGDIASRQMLARQNATRDLSNGITTSRDLGAPWGLDVRLKSEIEAGVVRGPRLDIACRPITAPGRHNSDFGVAVSSPSEARQAVRDQVHAGADWVKLIVSEGWQHDEPHELVLGSEEVKAAVLEAHRLGKRVAAHAHGENSIKVCLLAGVDTIEHGTDGVTVDLVELALKTGTPIVSTVASAWMVANRDSAGHTPELVERARRHHERELRGLSPCIARGATLAGATDLRGDMANEYRLLVEAGMTPLQAISAITAVPARILGRHDIGMIQVGRRADLVVVDGNPLCDSSALERLAAVYLDGIRV